MNAKQFAWTFLIMQGTPFAAVSYYGGYKIDLEALKAYDQELFTNCDKATYWDKYKAIKPSLLVDIQTVGVDWEKTSPPKSNLHSQFDGTFVDASAKEFLEGTLVLNNGKKQSWITGKPISTEDVFAMLEKATMFETKYHEIFGE